MLAFVPAIVMPVMVMVLLLPTVLVPNVADGEEGPKVMLSLPWIPSICAPDTLMRLVAAVVASYTLFDAVSPETVSSFVVMSAAADGCVST